MHYYFVSGIQFVIIVNVIGVTLFLYHYSTYSFLHFLIFQGHEGEAWPQGLCKYLGQHQDGHFIDIPVSAFVIDPACKLFF